MVCICRQVSLNGDRFLKSLKPFPASRQSLDPLDPLKAVFGESRLTKGYSSCINSHPQSVGWIFVLSFDSSFTYTVIWTFSCRKLFGGRAVLTRMHDWQQCLSVMVAFRRSQGAVLSAALLKITNSHLYCWHSWPWTIIITAHSDGSACAFTAEPV